MNKYIMNFEGLEPIICFLIIEWVFGGDIKDDGHVCKTGEDIIKVNKVKNILNNECDCYLDVSLLSTLNCGYFLNKFVL